MNEGATSCKGRSIPMPVLDGIVLESWRSASSRLTGWRHCCAACWTARATRRRSTLQRPRTCARIKGGRGTDRTPLRCPRGWDSRDTDMFRRSLAQVEGDREETLRMVAALEKHREVPRHLLTKSNIARFATAARARLRNENASLRKGYMRHLVSRVEVGDREIKVAAPTPALPMAYWTPATGRRSASFVQGWWAFLDTYRTLCIAPSPEIREIFEQLRDEPSILKLCPGAPRRES